MSLLVDSARKHPDIDCVQALLDARGPERERFIVNEVLWALDSGSITIVLPGFASAGA